MKRMKIFLAVIFVMASCVPVFAERTETDIINSAYYKIKHSIHESMPRTEGGIVFLGDSITDYVPFSELLPGLPVINRGIAGDNTLGALRRIDEVISLKPSKLFILLGTNDIVYNMTADRTAGNLTDIIRKVKEGSPSTKIFLETIMPVNPELESRRKNDVINALNVRVRAVAVETGVELVDTHSHMAENGVLPLKWTVDGLHLNGEGAVKWIEFIAPML